MFLWKLTHAIIVYFFLNAFVDLCSILSSTKYWKGTCCLPCTGIDPYLFILRISCYYTPQRKVCIRTDSVGDKYFTQGCRCI